MPDNGRAKPALLVFADDWGRHPSSCQHLIRRLRTEMPVVWANTVGTRQAKADAFTWRRGVEKLTSWSKGVQQVDRQMWTVDLPMLPPVGWVSPTLMRSVNHQLVAFRLKQVLNSLGLGRPIVLTTLPYIGWLIRGLPRRGLVYYCTDDYSHWPGADKETLQQADREISAEADLILAASQALLGQHARYGTTRYLPHGVDFDHFASTPRQQPDQEIARLPRPRIGYFGLIYEKLNFELLTAIAQQFPQGTLVMIGPNATSPPEFGNIANVHFLGPKPYNELPRYLAGLDALLLPYVDDPMIRQSGPLKLRECLATGKPTISIDVPEVRIFEPHVRVARDQTDFLQQVADALAEPTDSPAAQLRQLAVAADGWDARARLLHEWLTDLCMPAQRSASPSGQHSVNGQTNGCFDSPLVPRPSPLVPRVLHLRTVSGHGGGPEKTLLQSQRFLTGSYELKLAYIRPENDPEYDMPRRAAATGVSLLDIPERNGVDPRTYWRLVEEIRSFRPAILHAHDYKTNILAVALGRTFRIPAMTTMHGYVSRGGRLEVYYRLDRWALRRMDRVVAVSDDLYQTLIELGLPADRRSLVYNAIDADQYTRRHSPQAARSKLGWNSSRFLIGAVGRLAGEKGFDLLIRAVDRLLADSLDVELVIAGDGDERGRLQALIEQLGRADRIRLLGHQTDLPAIYEALDLFALSSHREGLPNVVLEAMALETPVVATKVGAVERLIEDGVNGLIVTAGDLNAMTQSLRRLIGDPDLRQRLAAAGRRTIETSFSFASRMEKIKGIYDSLHRIHRPGESSNYAPSVRSPHSVAGT